VTKEEELGTKIDKDSDTGTQLGPVGGRHPAGSLFFRNIIDEISGIPCHGQSG